MNEAQNFNANQLHKLACCVQLWACWLVSRAMWEGKAGIAQTLEFVSPVNVPARVSSMWGAAYCGCPQLSHNVVEVYEVLKASPNYN